MKYDLIHKRIRIVCLILACLVYLYFWKNIRYDISTHDLGNMDGLHTSGFGIGHLGYIEYLFKYHRIPDFDPRTVHSFYNPPVYHISAALLMTLFTKIGLSEKWILKSCTLVSCASMCISAFLSFLLLNRFGMKERTKTIIFCMLAFFPASYWLSFTANPDAMMVMFTLACILIALTWYEIPIPAENASGLEKKKWKRKNIGLLVFLAFILGIGMLVKVTVVLISPGIALLFIMKLKKLGKKGRQQMILPYALFLLISVPIGISWSLRNYFNFGVPFSYVQGDNSPTARYACMSATIADRIGIPHLSQLRTFALTDDIDASLNIWVQTVKTSIFDAGFLVNADKPERSNEFFILLCIAIVLAVLFLVFFLRALQRKNVMPMHQKVLLGTTYFVFMIMYLRLCFTYQYTFTANFRYVVIPFVVGTIGTGAELDHEPRWLYWITAVLSTILLFTGTYAYYRWMVEL